jgi:hypothetical protein
VLRVGNTQFKLRQCELLCYAWLVGTEDECGPLDVAKDIYHAWVEEVRFVVHLLVSVSPCYAEQTVHDEKLWKTSTKQRTKTCLFRTLSTLHSE